MNPRWQFGLRSLFVVITSICVWLGATTWLWRSAVPKPFVSSILMLAIFATYLFGANWRPYRKCAELAGPRLFNCARKPFDWTWTRNSFVILFLSAIFYLATSVTLDEQSGVTVALAILWAGMFFNIRAHQGPETDVRHNGVVYHSFFGWRFIPWDRCNVIARKTEPDVLLMKRGARFLSLTIDAEQRRQVESLVNQSQAVKNLDGGQRSELSSDIGFAGPYWIGRQEK
jgi:hypothetical protein